MNLLIGKIHYQYFFFTDNGLTIPDVKVGVPVVLLRNLDPVHGLCNGTRLKVVSMTTHLLTVEILNGSHSDNTAFIPRIDLIPTYTQQV